MLKRLLPVCAVALLTVGSYAAAVETRGDHPDTYVVKKGDTLWDIAGKFLKRPWLWPEIWQANPQINNPHLIYPGDVISLAYLDRVAVQEGPRGEAPITGVPLSEVEPFLKDVRVVDEFEHLPYVVSIEEDRSRGISGMSAYVVGLEGARPGQRYAFVRPTVRFTWLDRTACCDIGFKTDLDFRGARIFADYEEYWTTAVLPDKGYEQLGYELRQMNTGSVTMVAGGGVEASTIVLDEGGNEVRIGDRLIPVDAQPYDLQFFPHPPKQQFEYGRAQVIGVPDALYHGGPHDVIALSVGARDGVDNGTVFSVWRVGSNTPDRVQYSMNRSPDLFGDGSRVRLPDEFTGHVMVFRTFDKMSYGLIMDGIKPARIGYELKHPDTMQ
ncbi:LysM peptidoglycan-binding domain-containing protein [Noviluteimonas dokdonensis]|nr:LysM domain-containing protein [Lysobacter dokdonensis]